MKNLEIAALFYEIADMLEMQNVQWKPQAYRKAAKGLEALGEDVEEIYKKEGIDGFRKIPGVGENLALKIEQYIKTGKINEYEKLKRSMPAHLNDLMAISSLGPKKAIILNKKLGIKSVGDLGRAIKQHRIAKLFGFGAKTEENILRGIELMKRGQERKLLGIVLPIARDIAAKLKKLKEVDKIEVGGSIRRRKETIRDIDILITSKKPAPVMDLFTSLPDVDRVLAKGITKSSVILKNNMQVDLRVLDPKCFGAALQYFTGNKEHNIILRERAIKKGLKLSEYGLFNKKTNRLVAGKTEEEVYKKLGLPYIEPELRENTGEIDAALNKKLPKVIGYNDIKGDLHVHSKYSDGDDSIEDIANYAKKIGYEYICISDHSKSQHIAHGLDENRLLKQIDEIKKINKKLKNFRILMGSEVDIKSDGSLDFSDDILKKLDVVIASVHSGFKSPKEEMTNRVVKALKNENVDIFGHPTGRLINEREPYEIDLNEVFDVAKERKNLFLEINASPSRMDLNDANIKLAVSKGLKLAINTDSHSIMQLHYMELGIAAARRGWAEKKDIINCLGLKEIMKIFRISNYLNSAPSLASTATSLLTILPERKSKIFLPPRLNDHLVPLK
ncbi:MAG: DNA polymerase/3'-5' exonuclease PolX [Candidatus Woesearchaeota archaeon]|nr:DNA polymerase/3'-5' exonuclease PolX [Candidatus Woesearchaeota archaeon]